MSVIVPISGVFSTLQLLPFQRMTNETSIEPVNTYPATQTLSGAAASMDDTTVHMPSPLGLGTMCHAEPFQ